MRLLWTHRGDRGYMTLGVCCPCASYHIILITRRTVSAKLRNGSFRIQILFPVNFPEYPLTFLMKVSNDFNNHIAVESFIRIILILIQNNIDVNTVEK